MIYYFENYEIELIFDYDGHTMEINTGKDMYRNIFLYEQVKLSQHLVREIILGCFEMINGYTLKISIENEILSMIFLFENKLSDITLKLNAFKISDNFENDNSCNKRIKL